MSVYYDLTSTVKLDQKETETNVNQQKAKSKTSMKIQYNFQNNEMLEIQNQNRLLRQRLAKKQEQITYMSIKSIQLAKQYMRVLESLEQIQSQRNLQDKKLDKLVKKVQKYKNQKQTLFYKVQQLEQKIYTYELNKQSMQDKFQSQIENIKSINEQAFLKMQLLKKQIVNDSKMNSKIESFINQITDIIKTQ